MAAMEKEVKTYKTVVPDDDIDFRISRMEYLYKTRKGQPDSPHRHDYFTIIVSIKAKGIHAIDFNSVELGSYQIHFVSPGQVHSVKEEIAPKGFVLVFSEQFLIKNNIPLYFIEELNLFNQFTFPPPLLLNQSSITQFTNICQQIEETVNSSLKFKEHAIGALLKLFLIYSNNHLSLEKSNPQEQEAGNTTLREFKKLVDQKHQQWHKTGDYAEHLNISSDYLNRLVKSLIGKTAKEYIQNRILISAKRMLYFSSSSTKEISYQLGFIEPAHFSAFFKKHTNISPSSFRQKK